MKKLSIIENKLTDLQLHNLKIFPLVFFNGVIEVQINYNLDVGASEAEFEIFENQKKEKNIRYNFRRALPKTSVSYRLLIEKGADNLHIDKRCLALEKAVRDLFWKEIKVLVFIGNDNIYESKDV